MFVKNYHEKSFQDPSLWLLLFSNVVTIGFALTESWSMATVVWIYFFQSIIIGVFGALRILRLQEVFIPSLTINGKPYTSYTKEELNDMSSGQTRPVIEARIFGMPVKGYIPPVGTPITNTLTWGTAKALFVIVYFIVFGFSHFSYFIFLAIAYPLTLFQLGSIMSAVGLFFISHLCSFLTYKEKLSMADIASLITNPFIRVIPIHIISVLGLLLAQWGLLPFLLLKTLTDLSMHIRNRNLKRLNDELNTI